MKALKIFAATIPFAFAAISVPAHAVIAPYTTYKNLAAFEAAAGQTSVETFSSALLGDSNANYAGSFKGFNLSSIANGDRSGIATGTIGTSDNTAIPAAFQKQNFYGWGEGNDGKNGPTTLFTFTKPVTAFGFDWFNTDTSDSYSVTVNGLTQTVFNYKSSGFFGIVATNNQTFTSASIQNVNYGGYISTEGLDNVRVSAVPEPTGVALFGIAILGFMAARRRSRVQ